MVKHLKIYKKLYLPILILLVIILGYFFWPQRFKISSKKQVYIQINKEIEGTDYHYALNEQEISNFIEILKKAKFYHGVSRPDHIFAGKSTSVIVQGGLSPIITIYYENDKVYVWAKISNRIILNSYYRISNKEEIKNLIENIVLTKKSEFVKIPTS